MKKLFGLILLTASINVGLAQVPQLLNYQAVIRSSNGLPVANSNNLNMEFIIHDGGTTGMVVYQENVTLTSNQFGLVTYAIGSNGNLQSVNWGSDKKYLQVEIDVSGGSNYIDMGTTQLLSVPYALYARTSGNGIGVIGPTGRQGIDTGRILLALDTSGNSDWSDTLHLFAPHKMALTTRLRNISAISLANDNMLGRGLSGQAFGIISNDTTIIGTICYDGRPFGVNEFNMRVGYHQPYGYTSGLYVTWDTILNVSHNEIQNNDANGEKNLAIDNQYGVRYYNDVTGHNYISIDTSGYVSVNSAYTLPNADGAANYVLTTNGSGAVSWQTAASGTLPAYSNNVVAVAILGRGKYYVTDGTDATLAGGAKGLVMQTY